MVLWGLIVAAFCLAATWVPDAGAQEEVRYCKHRVTGEIIVIDRRERCPAFYYPV